MTKQIKTRKLTIVEQPQVQAPSVKAAQMLEHLSEKVAWDIKFSQEELTKWSAKFLDNAVYAFEWSRQTFEQAARNHSAKEVEHYINLGRKRQQEDEYTAPTDLDIIQETRRIVYEEVVRGARWPERSTSPQSNEMKTCLTAARAEWLVTFDQTLARIKE